MIYKALSTGSVTDKEGNKVRFWAGQTINVTKSNFDVGFDEHSGFKRADSKSKSEK